MTNVVVYTQNECPPCQFIKQYFDQHQVAYTEKNISNTEYRNEMIDYDAFSTPFILIDDIPMYQVDLDKINELLKIEGN
ncbi:glutaredoxin family protein [Staphylococcus simulans]|uniref:glutaredoxin family protein n=1 Tax=Staphylococcus simulans TaxID=1286 RepID=UPI000D03D50F|nr:glutaredoxin family protein [Staphylococcus simulans]